MSKITEQHYIRVPKMEYVRLKKIQEYFGAFWAYFEHVRGIKSARKDIKTGRVTPQDKVFQDLGI